ncbi:MAG TPA: hypothetical protein VMR37_00020 [Rhabdochlamydiaceae bacterium]|jgi:hypothetical protein|nr:hypothetical protein [Rhabdochlamydiaceae bacterium]
MDIGSISSQLVTEMQDDELQQEQDIATQQANASVQAAQTAFATSSIQSSNIPQS